MNHRVGYATAGGSRGRTVADAPIPDLPWFPPVKAAADVAIAAVLLALLCPIIAGLVVAVRLTSRGPAIFRQTRLGRDGRSFLLYKIRTMQHDCERISGPRWATSNDSRVTPLGRFLRRSHLDELPQLWNVLRGDMSLVGPRPERPEFVSRLEVTVPGYRRRMAVNPGITGLAQVQLPPDADVEDVRRKVACDLCYIREMGPTLDLKILIGTTFKVLGIPFGVTREVLNLPGLPAAGDGEAARVGDPTLSQLQSV